LCHNAYVRHNDTDKPQSHDHPKIHY
jgi:hypothetical protein